MENPTQNSNLSDYANISIEYNIINCTTSCSAKQRNIFAHVSRKFQARIKEILLHKITAFCYHSIKFEYFMSSSIKLGISENTY